VISSQLFTLKTAFSPKPDYIELVGFEDLTSFQITLLPADLVMMDDIYLFSDPLPQEESQTSDSSESSDS
jgi:hypothetical protein